MTTDGFPGPASSSASGSSAYPPHDDERSQPVKPASEPEPPEGAVAYASSWANGRPFTADEAGQIALLHDAGCACYLPLLGYRLGVGPRCRLCNTVASLSAPSAPTRADKIAAAIVPNQLDQYLPAWPCTPYCDGPCSPQCANGPYPSSALPSDGA